MHLLGEWYGQLWPNIVASLLTAGPMFVLHHLRMKAHITATAATPAEQLAAVPDVRVEDSARAEP